MRKIIFFLFATVIAMLLSGCATHENFVKQHNEWIGKSINDFITQAGYPDNSYEIPNGNKVYVYTKSRDYIFARHTIGYSYFGRRGGYLGGFPWGPGFNGYDIVTQTCILYMEVNKKGIIAKWGSKGNDCVADEPKNNVLK